MTDRPVDVRLERKHAFETATRSAVERPSDRHLVRALLPEIRRKREEGWSYADIHAALAETNGFKGTLSSLYSDVSKLSRAEKSPPDALPASELPTSEPPEPEESPQPDGQLTPHERQIKAYMRRKKNKPTLVEILNRPL